MLWVKAMTLVPINAVDGELAGMPGLEHALLSLSPHGRITVMIHGFKYAPGQPGRCPHDHIFSLTPDHSDPRVISWPARLGLGPDHLGIAFGWDGSGSFWRAWQRSADAGLLLARLIDQLAAMGHRVDLVAHSLGARVALGALQHAPAGSVGKAILIAPAEFQRRSQAALAAPAGRSAHILNVISRENAIYDRGLEWLVAPHRWGERSLGLGLDRDFPRWTDLRIDDARTRQSLAVIGYPIAAPTRRACHWSGYLRQGLFALYRAVLEDRLPLPVLNRALATTQTPSSAPHLLSELAPIRAEPA
jgi:pimeloyl-ACP methyl ester carboxylesterase